MSRIIRSALVAVAAGAVMLGGAASAMADEPNCTAADLAGITGGVSTATSAYLWTHPAVNDFMTSLKDLPKAERQQKIAEYMDANPQVKDELGAIRQPVVDFHNRCGVAD
ncbi:MAG: heme-binding protein [Mycobacterium sp.]